MSYRYDYERGIPIEPLPIECDICERVIRDFEFFQWPGAKYEAVLCPSCARKERERLAEQVEFWLDELGEYVTNL